MRDGGACDAQCSSTSFHAINDAGQVVGFSSRGAVAS